jgi:hypothetical protein
VQRQFDFADTPAARAFTERNKGFWGHLERVLAIANRCFGREIPSERGEHLLFKLGDVCRDDFLEIAFLAVNGHGVAAHKLLRGLYERAVTAEYLRRKPEKVERFLEYGLVQDWRSVKRALDIIPRAEFDETMGAGLTVADFEAGYKRVKTAFPGRRCDHCDKPLKGDAMGWDIDFTSMAMKCSEPGDDVFGKLFLICYTMSTLYIHATPWSAFGAVRAPKEEGVDVAEMALISATLVFIRALKTQDEAFSLGLGDEIKHCFDEVSTVWESRAHGPGARRGTAPSE